MDLSLWAEILHQTMLQEFEKSPVPIVLAGSIERIGKDSVSEYRS